MIKLGELVMILDLHRQGLSVSAIARQLGVDRKTVGTYIAKGLEPPAYKERAPAPAIVDPFEPYLRERLATYPGLTAVRLWREIKERGFAGGYSVVRDRAARSSPSAPPDSKCASRRRPASRRRSTSPSSTSSSPTSQGLSASSGSSRWCSVTAG